MKLYELQALSAMTKRAKEENGVISVSPYNGEVMFTREAFDALVAENDLLWGITSTGLKGVFYKKSKVADVGFVTILSEEELTESEKEDLNF